MPDYDLDHDLSHDEAEAEARKEEREAQRDAAYFELSYPSVKAAIQRVLSLEVFGQLRMREDTYDKLRELILDDIREFHHSEALKLAGVTPFDAWDVPTKKDDVK